MIKRRHTKKNPLIPAKAGIQAFYREVRQARQGVRPGRRGLQSLLVSLAVVADTADRPAFEQKAWIPAFAGMSG
jgi:hypothetical protein